MFLSDWLLVLRLRFGRRPRSFRRWLNSHRRRHGSLQQNTARLAEAENLEERVLLTAPTGLDDFFFTQESTELTVGLPGVLENDSDADGDPLIAQQLSGPTNGSLTLNDDGSFTFTPASGFVGSDSFTYQAFDGMEASGAVTVTIDVGDVAGDGAGSERVVTPAGGGSVELGGLIGDGSYGSADVDLFRVSLTTGETITIDVDAAQLDDGSSWSPLDSYLRLFDEYGFELDSNDDGTDPQTALVSSDSYLSFTATYDGTYIIGVSGAGNEFYYPDMPGMGNSGSTGAYQLSLNFSGGAASNTPPEFSQPSYTFDVAADASYGDVVGTLSATDADGDSFWFSDDGSAWPFELDSMTGEVRYMDSMGLSPGQNYSFTAMVSDNYGSDSASVTLNVTAANAPPTANADTATTPYETPITIDVLANDSDPEGGALTLVSVGTSAQGQTAINNGQVDFTPNNAFAGNASFTYVVSDPEGNTSTGSVTVTVTNNAPVALDDQAATDSQNGITIDVLANDSDPEASAIDVVSVTQPANGSVALVNGEVVYTPDGVFLGDETFTYTIEDPAGASATATVTVTVSSPILTAQDDDLGATQEVATTLDVLANDLVPAGANVTLAIETAATNGTLTVEGLQVLYTPNSGYTGADSFVYRVTDDLGRDSLATVTLTVAPNEAPIAVADELEIEAGIGIVLDVLANDSDPEGHQVTIVSAESPWIGTVSIDPGEGGEPDTLVYDVAGDTFGVDTLTYTIADQYGRTATATITLWITSRPVPEIDGVGLLEDTGHLEDLVTTNATVTGTVTTANEVAGLSIEADYNGDHVVDQTVQIDPQDGTFTFDFNAILPYGAALVSLRALELNESGQPVVAGHWQPFEFTYVASDEVDSTNEDDPGAALLGTVSVDVATAALVRLTGSVSDQNGGAEPSVEFDVNYDGTPDVLASTTAGSFTQDFTTEVGYGQSVEVRVRTKDVDDGTGDPIYGAWQIVSFSRDYPDNDSPAITQLVLANDTETAGDNITSDATISGTISHADGSLDAMVLEFDLNNDDVFEGTVSTDASGQFTIDLNGENLADGPVNVRVRTREWDPARQELLYGDWTAFDFEYTGNAARQPVVSGLALANDTGTPGDQITSDASISGIFVSGTVTLTQMSIEIDWNGDGQADRRFDSVDEVSGAFVVDITDDIPYSDTITVNLRAWGWDATGEEVLTGDWVEFTFTFETQAAPTATVTDLALVNDTGTVDDQVTSDPRISGRLTHPTESVSSTVIQYDLDGDGAYEGETTTDHRGRFTVDLSDSDLAYGAINVSVRGGVYSSDALSYDWGDWASFSFTYEEAPPAALPVVGGLVLLDDSDGDNTVSRAIVGGTVTDADSSVTLLVVEFDVDGDGNAEGQVFTDTVGTGGFLIDLTPYLTDDGAKTVQFRAADAESEEETFGNWTSFNFTFDAPDSEDNPQDGLVDDDDVPFDAAELAHVEFEQGELGVGITVDTVDTTQAGVFSTSYISQGGVVGTSDLLASIANADIDEDDPTNATSSNTDGNGNVTDVATTGTWQRTVTAITDPSTSEWYRYEYVVSSYDITTTYTGADGSGYSFHQWGTYSYTLEAYGYNGNSVYAFTEIHTDNYVDQQWSAADPTSVYVISGSQSYQVDSGGYVKVNDDGLAAPGSSASWVSTVDTVNPVIDGTNASAVLRGRAIISYGGMGYGRMEYSDYNASGSVDHNGDFSDSWNHWYYTREDTPAGFGTTRMEDFEYDSLHYDPYNITNSVNVNDTTNVGGIERTTVINDTTNLTGSTSAKYASQGSRTTYADGTWESIVTHTTIRELHDVYTHSGSRSFTVVDNSSPVATINQSSSATSNATRTRDSVQVHGTTTTRLVNGTQTVAGTLNGNSDASYDYSGSQTMNSDGTYDDGTTVMSFLTTGSSNTSGSGTYQQTTTGTFGTAGTNITNTYDSFEEGASDWDSSADSSRDSSTDDGNGNTSTSGGTSSSTNNGSSDYTNTMSVTESVTDAAVTSTGTLTHSGGGSGGSTYNQTNYSSSTSLTDTPESYSSSSNQNTSYSNGGGDWNSTSSGNGTITNGEADYTQTVTRTETGTFASGNTNTYTSYTAEDDGSRFESHDVFGDSQYDESGTYDSSSTDTTHTSPAGNSSSSSSNYSKQGDTSSSNNSTSMTIISEDYSGEDYPGSGTYESWHDEIHDSNSQSTSTGNYSITADSASATAIDGTWTSSTDSTYETSASGTTTAGGSSTIADYSHSEHNGVSSTSDSTSTVTTNSTTTFENDTSGESHEINGITTSLDTSSSTSDTVTTVDSQTDRENDNVDTNNTDKITSNSHSESHASNFTTTTSHAESESSNERFGNGTTASETTSSSTSDSNSTFSSNSSGNSQRNVNGLNGVESEETKNSSSDSSGTSSSHDESQSTRSTFPDGTWASTSSSSGNSTVSTTSNSSSSRDFDSKNTSTSVTKTVDSHTSQSTTNAQQTVNSSYASNSTGGSAGGTTESWTDETVTGGGTSESESNSTVRGEKDADNFEQQYKEQSRNGTYTINGSSRSDRFADGKTSSSSSFTRTDTGTSSRKTENTGKSKSVTNPQPGVTQTVSSDKTDTTNWTDITFTDTYSRNTSDPVDAPYSSTETSTQSESGKQNWNSTENSSSSTTGTVNDPESDSHGATLNNSASTTTTNIGNGDFSKSSNVIITTDDTSGNQEVSVQSGSNSFQGKSTMTISGNSSGSVTQNTTESGVTVNFSQTSSGKNGGTVVTTHDNSASYSTNGSGGTQSHSVENSSVTGFTTSSSNSSSTVAMSKTDYTFNRTEIKEERGGSTFTGNLSHTIDTDFDGTTTHSGGGTSTTKANSITENHYHSKTDQTQFLRRTISTNDREDITTAKTSGNAEVTFLANGTEDWSGKQVEDKTTKRDYLKTTTITKDSKTVTTTLPSGAEETTTTASGEWTKEHIKEDSISKSEYTIQSDGSLGQSKDILDPDTDYIDYERNETSGKGSMEFKVRTDTTVPGVTITETWNNVSINSGANESYDWSESSNSINKVWSSDSGLSLTQNSYTYQKDVDKSTANSTQKSSETITSKSSYSSANSQKKIKVGPRKEAVEESWMDHWNASESDYKHETSGTNTYTSQHTEYISEGYGAEIDVQTDSSHSWDWTYHRVEKSRRSEFQQREEGSSTAKAKVETEWSLKIDANGTWDDKVEIHSDGDPDGSLDVVTTVHEERLIDAAANVTSTTEFEITDPEGEEGDPVVTVTSDAPPTVSWHWNETRSGKASSVGSGSITKYEVIDYIDTDGDGMYDEEVWGSKSFSGSITGTYEDTLNASDSDPNAAWDYQSDGTSNLEDAGFVASYMNYFEGYYYTQQSYGSYSTEVYEFTSEVDMHVMEAEYESEMYHFSLFSELEDPSWLESAASGLNDAFRSMFPELASFLENAAAFTSEFVNQLIEDFETGAMIDGLAGLADGFLNAINPFDHWWSVPDIGPIYGNYDNYAIGRTVGTVAGIATSIAISAMGPGLVSCGTWAHKAMVAWEVADAVGGIGGAVTNIINNGGQVGLMDVVGIAGGIVSIGGLKGLMNKCFVGDTLVVLDKQDVIVTSTADEQMAGPSNLVGLILGGGLLFGAGAGWYFAHRKRVNQHQLPSRRTSRKKRMLLDLFGDGEFLDHLWLDPGTKKPLPAFALAGSGTLPAISREEALPIQREIGIDEVRQQDDEPSSAGESLETGFSPPTVTESPHKREQIRKRDVRNCTPRFSWLVKLICLLGLGFCLWQSAPGFFQPSPASILPVADAPAKSDATSNLLTRQIKDISPGMRVLAENPNLVGETLPPLQIDPTDWRLVTLEMAKADGEILTVELLRPEEEFQLAVVADGQTSEATTPVPDLIDLVLLLDPSLEIPVRVFQAAFAMPDALSEIAEAVKRIQRGESLFETVRNDEALVGRTLHLDLPEMGAVGSATIKSVKPCPTIHEGNGRIVTGRFIHKAANVIDLKITGIEEPIGTTDTHPFWSEDRQTFVPAGELRIGEELRTLGGEKTFVLATSPRGPPEDVFNIEIEGEHVYHIAETGVLVHNTCTPKSTGSHSKKLADDLTSNGYARPKGGYQAAHIVPTNNFTRRSASVQKSIKTAQSKFDKYLGSSLRDTAMNGFWAKAGHAGTHTDEYFLALGKAFKNVSSEASAKKVLQSLWKRIEKGDFVN